MGDGRSLPVKGIGNINMSIICLKGSIVDLEVHDVLYVPILSKNLISIGKLNKKGFKIVFEDDKCRIHLSRETIIECKQSAENENLFELPINEKEDDEKHALNTLSKTNNWRLWHYRLGHLGEQNMKILKSEETVINEQLTKEFCKDCALGKSKKLPHKTAENPSDLIIIHSDLAGPM